MNQGNMMKPRAIEVHDGLSDFSVEEVEQGIGEVRGVDCLTVNYAAGSATVRFDETRLHVSDINCANRGLRPAR
jgi:Cu2+-exporting ATPase